MHVVHSGSESHHHAIIDRHGHVMSRVIQKLSRQLWVNRIVEHFRRHLRQYLIIAGLQHFDLDRHTVASVLLKKVSNRSTPQILASPFKNPQPL
jgi:hypothetical protein